MTRSRHSSLASAVQTFVDSHQHVLKALTMRSYVGSLRRFVEFVGEGAVVLLDADNVTAYISSVADHRYMARGDCAVLKVFAKWCVRAGYFTGDPLLSVTTPKVPKWRPKPLDDRTAERAIELAGEHPTLGLRDRAIVMLSLDTGARPNEIRQLRYPEDIDLGKRLIFIREETSKTAAGHRTVPFSPKTANAVRDYIDRDRPERRGPLFLNAHGDPFTHYGFLEIHHRLRDRLREEGIEGYQAYRLRHSGITNRVRAGISTLIVQKLAGHKSPVTTQHYVGDLSEREIMGLPDAFSRVYRVS